MKQPWTKREKWLVVLCALLGLILINVSVRAVSYRSMLRNLGIGDVAFEAIDAATGETLSPHVSSKGAPSGEFLPTTFASRSEPPDRLRLQWIGVKPREFTVWSPGYRPQAVVCQTWDIGVKRVALEREEKRADEVPALAVP